MQNLGIHRNSDCLRTAGLASIGKPELAVELSHELVEAAARRLLASVASYVISTNRRLEPGELLRHEGRSYRLVEESPGVLLLCPSSPGGEGADAGTQPCSS